VSGEDSGPPPTSLLFDVFALSQAVGRFLAAAMRDSPLNPTEYAVYSAIFELEAASPTQLAARLGMRLTTFIDQLRTIEERGHAGRVSHPTDGRSYRVVLTASGREAHLAANRRFESADHLFRSQLPHGEAAAKAGLLGIRLAAEAAMTDSGPVLSPRPRAGRAG
jgi:DNA-binding MarR family transcriptional regulator